MANRFTNGKPILLPDQVPSLVDEHGNFKRSKIYRDNYGKQDFTNLDEVIAEIDAQYHRFLELIGKKPDYFEGHAAMSGNFIKGLHIVAEKYDLPILDFAFDNQPVSFKKETRFSPYMESMKPKYDPEKVFLTMLKHADEEVIPMMICHPGYLDQYILNTPNLTIPRTQEVDFAMDPKIRKIIEKEQIHLVRYSECK